MQRDVGKASVPATPIEGRAPLGGRFPAILDVPGGTRLDQSVETFQTSRVSRRVRAAERSPRFRHKPCAMKRCVIGWRIAGVLCILAANGTAYGEAWQIEPQLSTGIGHNDNWSLSANDPAKVSSARVAGDLALSRITELTEISGVVRLDKVKYWGDTDHLRDNSNQLFRFSGLFRDRDEVSQLRVAGSLRRDTLLRTVQVAFEPGDVGIDPDPDVDEGVVRVSVDRNRLYFRPSWTTNLTERVAAGVGYDYNKVTYDNAGGTGLLDFTDETLTGSVSYKATERDRFNVQYHANRYLAPDGDRHFDSRALVVGLDHGFSEILKGSLSLGTVSTSYDTPAESGDDKGMTLRVRGSRLAGLRRFSLLFGRARYPSGSGDVVQTDEIVFNMSQRLSEKTTVSLRARLFENSSLREDNPDVNRRFFSIRPRLRWRLTRWWYLDAFYQYRRQKRDIESTSAKGNEVYLSLVYSQPTTLD